MDRRAQSTWVRGAHRQEGSEYEGVGGEGRVESGWGAEGGAQMDRRAQSTWVRGAHRQEGSEYEGVGQMDRRAQSMREWVDGAE